MIADYKLWQVKDLDDECISAWRLIQTEAAVLESPYFCPEFTLSVAEVRPDVKVVSMSIDGKYRGFFPFQSSYSRSGRPVGSPLSDYHGMIIANNAQWDVDKFLSTAGLNSFFFDHFPKDLVDQRQVKRVREDVSPHIDLRDGYTSFLTKCRDRGSAYVQKTEGLARKLVREHGELTFTFDADCSTILPEIIRLKSAQYISTGVEDVFSHQWTRALVEVLSKQRSEYFSGLCSALWAGDSLVAAHFGICSSKKIHYWFPVYDPSFSKYSPGIILLLRIAENAAQQGYEFIDLGKGISQYKERLSSEGIPLIEGRFIASSLSAWPSRVRAAIEDFHDNSAAGKILDVPVRFVRRSDRMKRFL